MIILKNINARERRAELGPLHLDTTSQDVPISPVLSAAGALGLLKLRIHDSLGGHEDLVLPTSPTSTPETDPSQAIQEHNLDEQRAERSWKELDAVLYEHQWSAQNEVLIYEAQFAHQSVTPPLIAAYVSLVLATLGIKEPQILQFRLAMYEMCANVIEHGTPRQSSAEIGIHLALTPVEVQGWIQDSCEHFDLSAQPAGSVREHAETRASRGYGIHMMHQLLESIGHEFNQTGNRIHFRKRIAP